MTNLTETLGSLWLCAALFVSGSPRGAHQSNGANGKRDAARPPRVFLLDATHLETIRRRILDGDKTLASPLSRLERDAGKTLGEGPFSIVNKGVTPPSGDKHDYMSQAPYFWADPKSPNGLPYIRRDGERNPEINKITDHRSLDDLENSVETLALAYYFNGEEAYATKAVQLLRTFFLDPATRMNPNLEYAQFIPGVNTGRGIGLIETRGLTRVVDAIGLLGGSKALSAADGCWTVRMGGKKLPRRITTGPITMFR
jgi:hypothetical protein